MYSLLMHLRNYKVRRQNEMTDEHIDEVLTLYSVPKDCRKESYLASFEDIEKTISILIFLDMLIISKRRRCGYQYITTGHEENG